MQTDANNSVKYDFRRINDAGDAGGAATPLRGIPDEQMPETCATPSQPISAEGGAAAEPVRVMDELQRPRC